MKTISLKISDSLDAKLRRHAAATRQGISETVRHALEHELESTADFARSAQPYCGMFHGPSDLSTREGYGNQNAR